MCLINLELKIEYIDARRLVLNALRCWMFRSISTFDNPEFVTLGSLRLFNMHKLKCLKPFVFFFSFPPFFLCFRNLPNNLEACLVRKNKNKWYFYGNYIIITFLWQTDSLNKIY